MRTAVLLILAVAMRCDLLRLTKRLSCRGRLENRCRSKTKMAAPVSFSRWFDGSFVGWFKGAQFKDNLAALELTQPNVVEFFTHAAHVEANSRILS